jgi:molybdopterin converting factor small subunit
MSRVTVRYWASARAAAGLESEEFDADTLDQLLEAVRGGHEPKLTAVLAASSLLIDSVAVGHLNPEAVVLTPGAIVEVLPPFAGG